MRLPSTPLVALSILSTTLIACGDDPPSPADVRSALTNDLGYILREGEAALGATDSLPSGAAFGFATQISLGDTNGATLRALRPLTRFIDDIAPSSKSQSQSLDEEQSETDEILEMLNSKLFTDANHLGGGVYRVPSSLVCERTTWDPETDIETTEIDPECAQRLTDAQLRIRVASENDGLRFFVQVDANHDEPLSVYLSHTKLAVTFNLDDATSAMTALAPVFGESAPNVDLAGEITGAIEILGTAHANVSLSFDRAIAIKFAESGNDLDGPLATRLTSAAGKIIALDLDANAPKASLALGLGATTAHIPGDSLDPQATELALGGATVDASFENDTLTLANLSLGQSQTTVSIGGQQAVAIDLNPDNGRTLDATIAIDQATGAETLTVSPRLDLRQSRDHALLGDEAPVYDITRVLLEGSLLGGADGSLVQVLTGSLVLETDPAEYGFTAIAGQCVTTEDVYDDTTYTSYSLYTVGTCQ